VYVRELRGKATPGEAGSNRRIAVPEAEAAWDASVALVVV